MNTRRTFLRAALAASSAPLILPSRVFGADAPSKRITLAMIGMGLSPGAALVFLITGPATNTATIATVLKTMGLRVVVIYLITLAGCSLAAGWLLNRIITPQGITEQVHHHTSAAGYLEQICALFLVGLLISAVLPRKKKPCCHAR